MSPRAATFAATAAATTTTATLATPAAADPRFPSADGTAGVAASRGPAAAASHSRASRWHDRDERDACRDDSATAATTARPSSRARLLPLCQLCHESEPDLSKLRFKLSCYFFQPTALKCICRYLWCTFAKFQSLKLFVKIKKTLFAFAATLRQASILSAYH